jgi:hypothetical protein
MTMESVCSTLGRSTYTRAYNRSQQVGQGSRALLLEGLYAACLVHGHQEPGCVRQAYTTLPLHPLFLIPSITWQQVV